MENSHIFFLTLLIIYLSFKYTRRLLGKTEVFTITFFFLICYCVYAFIGSALINCIRFDAEDEWGIYSHKDNLLLVWYYVVLGWFCLLFGITIACEEERKKNVRVTVLQKQVLESDFMLSRYDSSIKSWNFFLRTLCLSLFVLLLYRAIVGSFPIEDVFSGLSAAQLGFLRSEATNNFTGKLYRYEMFTKDIPLFCYIFTLIMYKISGLKKWKILWGAYLAYNIFFTLSTLQKAPLIQFILVNYIVFTFINKKINVRILVLVGVISMGLIILMYMFFMGRAEDAIGDILGGALHRIFISSIIPFYWYIDYIQHKGFLYGTSFPNPGGILPFESKRLTVDIMEYAHGASDTVGSMPTVFIGEMYANFGVIGIILSAIFVGYLIQKIDIYILCKMRKRKTVLMCAIYLFFVNHIATYAESGISGIIVNTHIYIILLVAYLYNRKSIIRR